MATFSTDERSGFTSGHGNQGVYFGKITVTAAPAANDKYRLVFIPGGTKIHRIVVKNGDLDSGTTVTSKMGYEYADGSSGGDDDAFVAAGATTLRAAATTTYEVFPPVTVAKDSYLIITTPDAATGLGATATLEGKVEGEVLGIK